MNSDLARGLYFTLQRFRREPLPEALADVRKLEFASLDELRAVQAQRQLEQLRFAAAHVPHYRRVLRELAGELDRAREWPHVAALVQKLAIIEKAAVTESPADFTADTARQLATHLDRTSGSSGTPVVFPCDQQAWAYRHALTFRCMEAFGVAIGEPYAMFFGLHWSKSKRASVALRDRVFNRTRVSAYDITAATFEGHLARIRRRRPTHFQGYPSAVYEFCVLARERAVDLSELHLKAVFLTSEPLRAHQRALIESVTGSRCADMYGSAEGGLLATECPERGLHTTPEATWVDVRDSSTHRGEAIATDMMLRAFPMIRYAMGDELQIRAGTCTCGRAQPLLESIEGRSGEPITLPNGRVVNANLPSYIFKPLAELGVIRRYRFVQRTSGRLELLLLVSRLFTAAHLELVKRETLQAFGADVALDIRLVDNIPHLPNAKHRDYVREA